MINMPFLPDSAHIKLDPKYICNQDVFCLIGSNRPAAPIMKFDDFLFDTYRYRRYLEKLGFEDTEISKKIRGIIREMYGVK